MKVPYLDLKVKNTSHKKDLLNRFKNILHHGQIIEGKEVKKFEEKNIQKLTCFNNLDYKNDVDDLAALICSCDLIISIDSFIVRYRIAIITF